MAWNAQKNQIFFERARNWAAAVANLQEERQRLIDLYNNEASPGGVDEATFVDVPSIATKAELILLATKVMTPLNTMITAGSGSLAAEAGGRMQYLTPFLADQL